MKFFALVLFFVVSLFTLSSAAPIQPMPLRMIARQMDEQSTPMLVKARQFKEEQLNVMKREAASPEFGKRSFQGVSWKDRVRSLPLNRRAD